MYGVRQIDKSENWGSRCQLEEANISGNVHLAKMVCLVSLSVPLWLYPQNKGLQYDDLNVYHGTAYGQSGKFLITVSTDTQDVVLCCS